MCGDHVEEMEPSGLELFTAALGLGAWRLTQAVCAEDAEQFDLHVD